jgi:hypothetical protein
MADRIPLIVDSSSLQIKELPASDNLDLSSSGIVGVTSVTATGIISASSYYGDGSQLTGVGGEADITSSLFS